MEVNQPKVILYTIAELLDSPNPEWLVDGIIHKGGFAILYGPAASLKTFAALSLAASVTSEKPWLDRSVKGGPVVYIAAEGGAGITSRVKALIVSDRLNEEAPLHIVKEPVHFGDSKNILALHDVLGTLAEPPVLIIIDTLARCFFGMDENSSQDIGRLVHAINSFQRIGAAVLVVHHTGKNQSVGTRGSSALDAAADTVIECKRA